VKSFEDAPPSAPPGVSSVKPASGPVISSQRPSGSVPLPDDEPVARKSGAKTGDKASGKGAPSGKSRDAKKKKKRRTSTGMLIFIVLLIIGVLVGGGFGANAYVRSQYKTWPRMLKVVFGIGQTVVSPATVEKTVDSNGLPAHKFTVKGDNPDQLVVKLLNNQRITFVNGTATVTISDSFFIPANVTSDAETITAEVSFAVLDNHNKETPVPCDPIVIEVPLSVVTDMSPAETSVETYQTSITLSMTVLDNSKVTINGTDESANINAGAFSKSLPVTMGANTFDVVVTTPYYRPFKRIVAVTRTLPPVAINVPTAPLKRTENSSITFTGTMEKGATLTLTGKGSLSYSKSAGTFTVKVSMGSLGLYEGTLTATLAGKNPGVYKYRVERVPNMAAYTAAAQTPATATLFSNLSSYINKKLKLVGTVTAVEPDKFTISLGENQQLTVSYYGTTVITVGSQYNVYGEIKSVSAGVATCYAWFVT
jgi:hypothetical protein